MGRRFERYVAKENLSVAKEEYEFRVAVPEPTPHTAPKVPPSNITSALIISLGCPRGMLWIFSMRVLVDRCLFEEIYTGDKTWEVTGQVSGLWDPLT